MRPLQQLDHGVIRDSIHTVFCIPFETPATRLVFVRPLVAAAQYGRQADRRIALAPVGASWGNSNA